MTVRSSPVQFSTLSPSILEHEHRRRVGRQIAAVLDDHLPGGMRGRRLLDIGCSSGIITSLLAESCESAVGIDVDAEAVRLARAEARTSNVEFLVMSGSTLTFASGSFDIVICNQVYYWLEDPERLMAEILRVLKPGGTCFFASVNKYTLWENQYRLPLLPMLPKSAADFLVRISGRGDAFGCRYLSFWQLTQLCRDFVVHRYTARIMKDPTKYRFTNLSGLKGFTKVLPPRLLELLEPISPNLIWVLDKPSGGPRRP